MMEFTLSRVVLAVCGVLLLGAVIAPFAASEDNAVSDLYQNEVDTIARTMDAFYDSSQDSSYVDMGDLLPTDECSLKFNGRQMTLNDGTRDYTAYCEHSIEPDKESYDSNDFLFMYKEDGKVIIISFR